MNQIKPFDATPWLLHHGIKSTLTQARHNHSTETNIHILIVRTQCCSCLLMCVMGSFFFIRTTPEKENERFTFHRKKPFIKIPEKHESHLKFHQNSFRTSGREERMERELRFSAGLSNSFQASIASISGSCLTDTTISYVRRFQCSRGRSSGDVTASRKASAWCVKDVSKCKATVNTSSSSFCCFTVEALPKKFWFIIEITTRRFIYGLVVFNVFLSQVYGREK